MNPTTVFDCLRTGIRCSFSPILLSAALALTSLSLCPATTSADEWPQFRGIGSDGVASDAFPTQWSESRNVRWQVDVPGEGWSCPVVWGDRVILTAAVPMAATELGDSYRPEQYSGGGGRRRSDLTQTDYRWDVLCYDTSSGQLMWSETVRTGKPPVPRHSSNTFATETPITDGQRIYAYFGMTGLYCLDMDGNLLWQKDLGVYEMRAGWGTSSSPVLWQDQLYLQIDNEQQSFLVSLAAANGEEQWRVSRGESSQYSSPIVWNNSLRDELIVGGMHYRSYNPNTGALLWELDMQKGRSSATPLAVGDRLFVGTEFRNRGGADDGGGFMFAIRPGGSGDISPKAGEPSSEYVVWSQPESGIQMASPAYCQGHLYLLERRRGIVTCLDAETGEIAYKKRLPKSRVFWSSPWTYEDKIFCLDDSGTTHVLHAGPEFNVLGRNEIPEQTWSSPAIADGALYLRTASKLYCISNTP